MSKNDKPDNKNNGDTSEEELQRIEGWLDELPEFDEKKASTFTYEDLLEYIEKAKSGDEHIDNIMIVSKLTETLTREIDAEHIDVLFDLLKDYNADCSDYSMMGMSAYELKNFAIAEKAYRSAIEYCSEAFLMTGYKNNLAYLIRRKEIGNPEARSKKEVPTLLRDGVSKKDTFSLINMALFWALECGNEDDWELVDKLVSYVNKSDASGAFGWWKDVALAGDAEGYLVHLLLIRHGKVDKSPLGSMEELFDRVKKEWPKIPDNMKNIVTPYDGVDWSGFPTFPPTDW